MDRINNLLYYMLIIVFLIAACFFFHSYLLAIAIAVFVLLPIVSLIMLRLSSKRISISFEDNETVFKRGEDSRINITLKNRSIVPVLNLFFKLEMVNGFSGQVQTRYINASVPAKGKRIVTLDFKPVLCGRISIIVSEISIRDLLSFFQIKKADTARLSVNVMPRRVKLGEVSKTADSVADDSEKAHRDSAGTEIIDIREYVKGDSLKAIHWKVSAKKDELFVKEKGDNISERAILLFELNKKEINGILDIVYTTARSFIKENQPIKIFWAGSGKEQLSYCVIEQEKDIYTMFERVYLSSATTKEGHTLSAARRQLSGGSVLYISSAEKGVSTVNL